MLFEWSRYSYLERRHSRACVSVSELCIIHICSRQCRQPCTPHGREWPKGVPCNWNGFVIFGCPTLFPLFCSLNGVAIPIWSGDIRVHACENPPSQVCVLFDERRCERRCHIYIGAGLKGSAFPTPPVSNEDISGPIKVSALSLVSFCSIQCPPSGNAFARPISPIGQRQNASLWGGCNNTFTAANVDSSGYYMPANVRKASIANEIVF